VIVFQRYKSNRGDLENTEIRGYSKFSSASAVLSDVSFYQLVTWSGTGYVVATEFELGKGYWLLVLEDTSISITV